MTWKDRTRQFINFISPSGNTFEALWIKNNRTLTKKLGIFELPERTGAKVQDLDTGAARYPITFFFDGPDNDIESERFFQSCNERGLWSVTHPTKGVLNLQLMTITEEINPTENGNFTAFNSTWIEPNQNTEGISTAQLSQKVNNGINNINQSSFDQFIDITKQDKVSQTSAIETQTKIISAISDTSLSSLTETSAEISAQVKSIQRGILDTISQPLIETSDLAGQIQNLVQLPNIVTTDALSRVSSYSVLIGSLILTLPEKPDQDSINTIAVNELVLISILGSLAQIGTTSDLTIRTESIGLIESIFNQFEIITNYLDSAQELFENNDIDIQYFSQSQSFSDSLTTIMDSAQFLLQKSFDLKIEKRFLLQHDEAPIITTINEYETLGENDENFDFFIETNQLKSNDILLMKSGREVVVYV